MGVVKYRGPNEAVFTFDPDNPKQFSLESFRRLVKNGTFEVVEGDLSEAAVTDDNDVDPGDDGQDVDLDELRDHAARLGVDVNRRWGAKRLQKEIAAVADASTADEEPDNTDDASDDDGE